MFSNKIKQKLSTKYFCEFCNYETVRKSNMDTHYLSAKHKSAMFSNEIKQKLSNQFICHNCSKEYKDYSGLWRHKKKCTLIQENEENEENMEKSDKELVMLLIKQNTELVKDNSEFKNMMMKVLENGTHNTTNNINSHNKSFNLNFFLNETCKDAMNINEFIESIKLQLSDLERVGELGYVEGISNIIVEKLKCLDVTQRPVHCTDKKRETIYIKDDNKWEKDDEKEKMHKIVRKVADKNARMLPKFKEAHPDCNKAVSKYSDAYNKIIVESMGGSGDNNFEKEEKIIKKVAKEIILEKEPTSL